MTMTIDIQFFALAKELAGTEQMTIPLPESGQVGDLRRALGEAVPALIPILPHLLFALGDSCVDDATSLYPGARVVTFPPVSGG